MYIIENMVNSGFKQNLLLLVSIIAVISGILVIINKNPVRSVLFLIGLFLTIAVYLFVLDISFIALAYLLVYVGAVSILFLFILMLINIRVSELTTDNSNSIPLSIIIITVFSIIFSSSKAKLLFSTKYENLVLLLNRDLDSKDIDLAFNNTTNISIFESESIHTNSFIIKESNEKISLVFSCIWDNILGEMSHITSIGNILYVSYSIGILIVGLILLLSMVGAISITSTSKQE